jgi:hypothetical protein
MRVWLVEDTNSNNSIPLEPLLREMEGPSTTQIQILGVSAFQSDFPQAIRKLLPDLLDVLIVQEAGWPDGPWTGELLGLGLNMLVVAPPERHQRFRAFLEQYPIGLASSAPDKDALWCALHTVAACSRRERQWKNQVLRLQQRLNDRVVIERAKGILVQRLKISEEDAYKRLRVLSRRQRRQIRDIAQSLLDTQYLFSVDVNGFAALEEEPGLPEAGLE